MHASSAAWSVAVPIALHLGNYCLLSSLEFCNVLVLSKAKFLSVYCDAPISAELWGQ